MANPVPADGKILITLPDDFTISSGSTTAIGAAGTSFDGSESVGISGQTVTLTRSGGSILTASTAVTVELTNIKNPTVTGSTGTYTLKTATAADAVIDQDTSVTADTITPGSISSTDVEPESLVAGVVGDVDVSFTLVNPLPADGKILITLPSGFTISSGGTTAIGGDGTSFDGSESVGIASQVITLTRSGGSELTASTAVTIELTNIKNSTTAGSTGTYSIQTTTGADVAIDQDTAVNADTITFAAANKMEVTTQPSSSTVAGVAFTQQPVVTIQDEFGNTVTDSTLTVTASLQTGDGTLSGTAAVAASSGVVTYSGLSINLTGTDKVLRFTQSSLSNTTVDTSPAFTITFAAANKLGVTTQPSSSTVAGVAFSQQPVVAIQDEFGNTVTNSSLSVTASLQTGDGSLSGTVSVAASSGVATYSGLSINLVGTDKVLRFTQSSLTNTTTDTTPAFTITFAAANKLGVTTQPSSSNISGEAFSTQPVVAIQGEFGNTVTNSSLSVTASLQTGTGTLSGTLTVAASSGVVTYSGLSIDSAGTNKVIRFTQSSLTNQTTDTSPAFTIVAVGDLTSTNVEPESLVAGVTGDVNVSFTLENALAADGKVLVIFGSGFALDSGGSTAVGAAGTSFDGSESVAVSGQTVTITRSGGNSVSGSSSVTLELTNVKNPTAAGSTGTYSIRTTLSNDVTVD